MQLVERHIIVKNDAVSGICFKSARLYNYCNYILRQAFFNNDEPINEYELTKLLASEDQPDYRKLPIQSSQQIVKLLYRNWKAYIKANKQYDKTPKIFLGKPQIPQYKDKQGFGICLFTNQNAKLKDGYIHFPKSTFIKPVKTKVDNFCQVRIVPQAVCFVIEIVYEKKEVKDENIKEENFLSIDLGINNLIATSNNVGVRPFIVNGKPIKSVNQMLNKSKAKLMSYIGDKGTSNKIGKLTNYRNNYIEDKLHKISRYVINYCIENHIGTIVIGHNTDWKQSSNMGKSTNQKFICIPHSKLIQKITYKSGLVGIKVIETEESHTSKIDHLAFEPMKHQESYLGKRKKRGLFQSSFKKLINADINGAIGIARKVFGDSVISQIFDSGLAFNPVKVNIF